MQALELLLNRASQPKLIEPAPQGEALENIKQAGLRAPDHACLKPWKFVVCTGQGLSKLGQLFKACAVADNRDEATLERAPNLPLRAPMVIVAMTDYKEHPKVPPVEQVCSAACTVQAMQMAAVAQGFEGIWRTGWYAQHPLMKESFNCGEHDEIVGFLYLGSSNLKCMPKPAVNSEQFFEHWD